MEKYRVISKWTSDHRPMGYRQDGKPQERVEALGILSEEEAKYTLEYFNKHLTDGAWIADRYELDDDKYRCFELILPPAIQKAEEAYTEIKTKEVAPVIIIEKPIVESKVEVIEEPIVEPKTETVDEPIVESTPEVVPEKKKRNKVQRVEYFKPVAKIVKSDLLNTEEIFGSTKTIYVAKYIATQRNLGPNIQKINGRIPSEERVQIYTDFNNNLVEEISITEAVVRLGGTRYEANGKEINVVFLDEIDFRSQEFILGKINKKF